MIENSWQLQNAKNKFSYFVDKAQHDGPQIVTKHGKDAVVVLSIDEYRKLVKPETNLVEFFRDSPFAGADLEIIRSKEPPREINL